MIITDVEGVANRCLGVDDCNDPPDSVIYMAEAAGLGSGAVDGERFILERCGDKSGDDHSVVTNLARANSVEEADDASSQAFFEVIELRKRFIDRFCFGVGPSSLEGGSNDTVRFFVKGT